MATKGRVYNGSLEYYEGTTHERMFVARSLHYADDFVGAGKVVIPAAGSAESGMPWVKKIVGAAPPTVAGVADAAGGVVACTLTSDSQEQEASFYHGDQRNFILTRKLIWEAWVTVQVLPTLAAECVWGLIGDWGATPDATTYNAFFTADGSGEVFCETDDNTTDSSATSGITVVAAESHLYRIDFTDMANILFFIDGARVASGTTFG